jgi:hypothetical protein
VTVDAPLMAPVEAGGETHEITHAKPGRKPLPEGDKIQYHDERVSMRTEYWKALHRGAESLNVLSLSGKNRGKPSWRAMIRFLCENMDWVVLAVRMIRRMNEVSRAALLQQYHDEEQIREALRDLEAEIERDTIASATAFHAGEAAPLDESAVLIRANRIMGLRMELGEVIRRLEVRVAVPDDQAVRLSLADSVAP